MKMRSIGLDLMIGLWVLLAGAAFCMSLVCGTGLAWSELELVARCVYVGVVTIALIGLALRVLRIARR